MKTAFKTTGSPGCDFFQQKQKNPPSNLSNSQISLFSIALRMKEQSPTDNSIAPLQQSGHSYAISSLQAILSTSEVPEHLRSGLEEALLCLHQQSASSSKIDMIHPSPDEKETQQHQLSTQPLSFVCQDQTALSDSFAVSEGDEENKSDIHQQSELFVRTADINHQTPHSSQQRPSLPPSIGHSSLLSDTDGELSSASKLGSKAQTTLNDAEMYQKKLLTRRLAKERRNQKARRLFGKLLNLPSIDSHSSLEEAFILNEQKRSGLLPLAISDLSDNLPRSSLSRTINSTAETKNFVVLRTFDSVSHHHTPSPVFSSTSKSSPTPSLDGQITIHPERPQAISTPNHLPHSPLSFYSPQSQPVPTFPSVRTKSHPVQSQQLSPSTNMPQTTETGFTTSLAHQSSVQSVSDPTHDQTDSVPSARSVFSNSSQGLSISASQTSDMFSSAYSRYSHTSSVGSDSSTSIVSSFVTTTQSSLISSSSIPSSTAHSPSHSIRSQNNVHSETEKTRSDSSLAPFTPPPQPFPANSNTPHNSSDAANTDDNLIAQRGSLGDGRHSLDSREWKRLDKGHTDSLANIEQIRPILDFTEEQEEMFSLSDHDNDNTLPVLKKNALVPLPVLINPSVTPKRKALLRKYSSLPTSDSTSAPDTSTSQTGTDSHYSPITSPETSMSSTSTSCLSLMRLQSLFHPLIANGAMTMADILTIIPQDILQSLTTSSSLQPDAIPPSVISPPKTKPEQHHHIPPVLRMVNTNNSHSIRKQTISRSIKAMTLFRRDMTESISSNDSSTVSDLSHAVLSWKEETSSNRQVGGISDPWKEWEPIVSFDKHLAPVFLSSQSDSLKHFDPSNPATQTNHSLFFSNANSIRITSAQTLPARLRPSNTSRTTVGTLATHPAGVFVPRSDSLTPPSGSGSQSLSRNRTTHSTLVPTSLPLPTRSPSGSAELVPKTQLIRPSVRKGKKGAMDLFAFRTSLPHNFPSTRRSPSRSQSTSLEHLPKTLTSSSTSKSKDSLWNRTRLPPIGALGPKHKSEIIQSGFSQIRSQSLTQLASLPPHPHHVRSSRAESKSAEEGKEAHTSRSDTHPLSALVEDTSGPSLRADSATLSPRSPATVEHPAEPAITTSSSPKTRDSEQTVANLPAQVVPPGPTHSDKPQSTPDTTQQTNNSARSTDISLESDYSHLSTTSMDGFLTLSEDHSESPEQAQRPLITHQTDISSAIVYESEQEMLRRQSEDSPSLPDLQNCPHEPLQRGTASLAPPTQRLLDSRHFSRHKPPQPGFPYPTATSSNSTSSASLTISSASLQTLSTGAPLSPLGRNVSNSDWLTSKTDQNTPTAPKMGQHVLSRFRLSLQTPPPDSIFTSGPPSVEDSAFTSLPSIDYLSSISSQSQTQSQRDSFDREAALFSMDDTMSPSTSFNKPLSVFSDVPRKSLGRLLAGRKVSMSQPQLQSLHRLEPYLVNKLDDGSLWSLQIDEQGQDGWTEAASHNESPMLEDVLPVEELLRSVSPDVHQPSSHDSSKKLVSRSNSSQIQSDGSQQAESSQQLDSLHTLNRVESGSPALITESSHSLTSNVTANTNSRHTIKRMSGIIPPISPIHKSASGYLPPRTVVSNRNVSPKLLSTSTTMPLLAGLEKDGHRSDPQTAPDEPEGKDERLLSPSKPREHRHRKNKGPRATHSHRTRHRSPSQHKTLTNQHRSKTQKDLNPETRQRHHHGHRTSSTRSVKSSSLTQRSESVDWHLLMYLMNSLAVETEECDELADLSDGERKDIQELVLLQRMDAFLLLRMERDRRGLLAKREAALKKHKSKDQPSHVSHSDRQRRHTRKHRSPEESELSLHLPQHRRESVDELEGVTKTEMNARPISPQAQSDMRHAVEDQVLVKEDGEAKKKRRMEVRMEKTDDAIFSKVFEELLDITRRYKAKKVEKEKEKHDDRHSRAHSRHKSRHQPKSERISNTPPKRNISSSVPERNSSLQNDSFTSALDKTDGINEHSLSPEPPSKEFREHQHDTPGQAHNQPSDQIITVFLLPLPNTVENTARQGQNDNFFTEDTFDHRIPLNDDVNASFLRTKQVLDSMASVKQRPKSAQDREVDSILTDFESAKDTHASEMILLSNEIDFLLGKTSHDAFLKHQHSASFGKMGSYRLLTRIPTSEPPPKPKTLTKRQQEKLMWEDFTQELEDRRSKRPGKIKPTPISKMREKRPEHHAWVKQSSNRAIMEILYDMNHPEPSKNRHQRPRTAQPSFRKEPQLDLSFFVTEMETPPDQSSRSPLTSKRPQTAQSRTHRLFFAPPKPPPAPPRPSIDIKLDEVRRRRERILAEDARRREALGRQLARNQSSRSAKAITRPNTASSITRSSYTSDRPIMVRSSPLSSTTSKRQTTFNKHKYIQFSVLLICSSRIGAISDAFCDFRAKKKIIHTITEKKRQIEEQRQKEEDEIRLNRAAIIPAFRIIEPLFGQIALHQAVVQRVSLSQLISSFLLEVKTTSIFSLRLHAFRQQIIKCQRLVSSFLRCQFARLLCYERLWHREEQKLLKSPELYALPQTHPAHSISILESRFPDQMQSIYTFMKYVNTARARSRPRLAGKAQGITSHRLTQPPSTPSAVMSEADADEMSVALGLITRSHLAKKAPKKKEKKLVFLVNQRIRHSIIKQYITKIRQTQIRGMMWREKQKLVEQEKKRQSNEDEEESEDEDIIQQKGVDYWGWVSVLIREMVLLGFEEVLNRREKTEMAEDEFD
ncbi:hypothetical protein BLNAU_15424 [Blattamonas nauphoetae]|uniref:Uncharacterized protein n=1 Tax=Blattamonas nauphoetae TaxID=2049346 RepID=A0ABQ9XAX2_9EUKA|nr:hypothetical protein BLNAU_15424 [Blattamonas nauphoetae]